jgi:Cys-tRNA(Pro) deacylase
MPGAIDRLQASAAAEGLTVEIVTLSQATRTAEDAARAIGCDVAAIVKSLVFTVDGEPVVALVPGDRRLDVRLLARLAGGTHVARASLDLVRSATGYVAGGTPPFGHARPLRVFADEALRRHDPVWAGGGTPHAVFAIGQADLDRVAAPIWGVLSRPSDSPN